MTPAVQALIAAAIAEIAKRIPALAIDLIRILSRPDATDADWDALEAKWSGKSYDEYLNAARAAKTTVTP